MTTQKIYDTISIQINSPKERLDYKSCGGFFVIKVIKKSMETQNIVETLYITEDILRKRIPFNEALEKEIFEELAQAQRQIEEITKELKELLCEK